MEWGLIGVAAGALLVWLVVGSRTAVPDVGDAAPDFSLPDHLGRMHTLADFRGRWLVLYFYPRADTPVCAEQAARFADAMEELDALGARVCGVSVDGGERLARFAARYKLPFTLLSDRGGRIAARYGSFLGLGLLGVAKRNTFLIDPEGRVAKVYLKVSPARNVAQVVADIQEMKRP